MGMDGMRRRVHGGGPQSGAASTPSSKETQLLVPPSAWGVYGQFGLFFLPGPKVPSVSANRLVSEEVGRFWLRSCDPCTVSDR